MSVSLYLYISILREAPEFHKKHGPKIKFPSLESIKKNHFRVADPPGIPLDFYSGKNQLKNYLLNPRPEIYQI